MIHDLDDNLVCPVCGNTIDRSAHIEPEPPGPGDLTVCLYCETVLEFTKEMTLIKPKKIEERDKAGIRQALLYIKMIKAYKEYKIRMN